MKHYIYKTYSEDGYYYIGRHSTKYNDSYKGSGNWVKKCKQDEIKLKTEILEYCSSTDEFPELRKYGFGVVVSTCKERRNAGQNRNIAARRLTTDLISFFDADDHMHPQRIEGLLVAFNPQCDIALHSYSEWKETKIPYKYIDTFSIIRNKLVQAPSGCIYLDPYSRIHHSQVTVRREIFERSPFSEEKEHEVKEDCVFCYRVFNIGGIKTAYIAAPLSKYIPSFGMAQYADGKI